MKVYIQKDSEGEFASINFFLAYDSFRKMGWEIISFTKGESFTDLKPENVVVGYIDAFYSSLKKLNITCPVEINYPQELQEFLGRKIWKSKINYIASHPEEWNIFIKPAYASKKFTGRLVRSTKDLISCGDEFEDTEVWCSEPVNFLAEWRCFVRYRKILDVRIYKGDWRATFDYRVIEKAVEAYKSAPNGYAIDFGCTKKGETLLVEVNDGYSLGSYGLFPLDYAKLLSARWAEITGTKDYCDF
ncbi:ATP-grasp domain-containing protein [Nostoc sp.]|uniref:ATP-grasp domain-containing protein n=1 Tax=Nostoc sp. TaxID=1180 RepID=UPI002FFC8CE1